MLREVSAGVTSLAILLAQVPAQGQAVVIGQPASAKPESEIPEVSPQTTAAATLPLPPTKNDPRLPLRTFTPAYPYPTNPPSTDDTGILPVTTLTDAITLAYKSHPQLLAQRQTVRATDYRYPEARARYGPTIDAIGNYAFTRDRTDVLSGIAVPVHGWASAASIVLTEPVFTFGRNKAAESTALSQVAYQRDVLRITEAQVLLAVVTSYVGVLRDATAVTIAQQNVALLERQFSDNTERFRVREITSTDLEQVQTRLNFARGQLVQAQGQLGASQSHFLRDVGAPPGELRQPDVLVIPTSTLGEAYRIADSESPIIGAAQSREKISRAAISASKAEFLPRLDLRSSADYGSVSPYSDALRTTRLQSEATVRVPLFNGGLRQALLGEAREANQADWRLIDQAQRETRSAVAEAWNQLSGARTSLSFYLSAVDSARRAYEGARLQQRAGAITTIDVLNLASDLLTVQTNYNTALANEYLARAQLLSALGRLEAPSLLPGLSRYDPVAHFRKVAHRGDLPLLTPLLSALDGVVLPLVKGDRPVRDPAASAATAGTVPMLPDSAALPENPTTRLPGGGRSVAGSAGQ